MGRGAVCQSYFLSVICLKDTVGRGEASSPHDVIGVVIHGRKQKLQQAMLESGWRGFRMLKQIEFFRAADGRPSVVDPQFVENVFRVGAQRVERHN